MKDAFSILIVSLWVGAVLFSLFMASRKSARLRRYRVRLRTGLDEVIAAEDVLTDCGLVQLVVGDVAVVAYRLKDVYRIARVVDGTSV